MEPIEPVSRSRTRRGIFRSVGSLFYRHLVHLTIAGVLGGTYVIAWCKSVELGDRPTIYPAPAARVSAERLSRDTTGPRPYYGQPLDERSADAD
jgi:hypothetical protein